MTTNQNALITLSASEAAEGLRNGDFTSEQLTQAHLDRIETTEGTAVDTEDRS